MALVAIKETTNWEYRNHTYLFDEETKKCPAYHMDTGEIKVFSKPFLFYKKGRTFKKVQDQELINSILTQP